MKLNRPKFLATENVIIEIADGTDENGALNIVSVVETKARVESTNSIVYTKEGVKTTLKQKLFIFDRFDKIPDCASGFCTVNNIKYDVAFTAKYKNPDGTMNHVLMGLM